ncbi:MAG: hypothetical protein ABW069_20855 [Duganella sp.]
MFAIRPWRRSPAPHRNAVFNALALGLALALLLLLSACGGGGDNGCTTVDPGRDPNLPGCSTTTPPVVPPVIAPVMSLTLTDTAGNAATGIGTDRPGILVAKFENGSKVAVANTVLTFTTSDRTGVFLPASGTAITDATGVARITLAVGTVAGAYTVTVTGTVDGKTATAAVNYNVALQAAGSSSLALALNSINGVPATVVTPAAAGSLAATLRNAAGAAVPNTVVSFTTTDTTATLVPATGTALTNAQGLAQVALPAGTQNGAFTATARATVDGVAVTATSSYTVALPPPNPPVPPVPPPTLTLSVTGAGGAATTSVAPDRPATLTAVVRNTASAPVANALVTFVSNDRSATLTPANGAALTDASGRASVTLNAGASPGGFSVSASSTVDGTAVAAGANYAVAYPTLSLAAPAIAPATLAAGGTASVAVTVLNGGAPYVPPLSVSFTSPCASAGKARLTSPVTTVNGVASTSYTDLGCGTADAITASATYNGAGLTASGTVTVRLPAAGQLTFVSALPQNIALKGTGGAGRQETATVTFKVLDGAGKPIGGQTVSFSLNTSVGGVTVSPASAVTASDGTVSTTVASGTVNTPVRVAASVAGGISTVSDQLVVSTGVPEQAGFSLAAVIRNVEGGAFNGCPAPNGTTIAARLTDRFRNPAPDGTAVSFTAEGGSIDASCLTGLTSTTLTDGTVVTQKGTPGECTVRFCAGSPRPADGRVTVLAYALGEESFVDTNGNNQYDASEPYTDLGEPFRNDRAVTDANAGGVDDAFVQNNNVRAAGEPYIDTNGNGAWDTAGNGVYNGVLRAANAGGSSDTVHIRQPLVMVLSNSTAAIDLLDQAVNNAPTIGTLALDQCVTGTVFQNVPRSFRFAIRDNNPVVFAPNRQSAHPGDPAWLFDRPGNPLPAGTTIRYTVSNGRLLSSDSAVVANTGAADSSAWVYTVLLASDAVQDSANNCSNGIRNGTLNITVTTPAGVVTSASYPVTD